MPNYYLGVDGGSSKTLAVIASSDGYICGYGRGRGSNWTGDDIEIPMTVVVDTVRQAVNHCDLETGLFVDTGVFTLAGADWPEDHVLRQEFLERAGIAQRVIVKNDAFGGLRAGTTNPYGIVIAAGSGVNAAAITPDGQEVAFGYYATYGGAEDLATDAFVAMLRQADGRGPATALTGSILQTLQVPSVEAALRLHIAHKIGFERFLSLCPLVFQAAAIGDQVAQDILVRQGQTLAEYAIALIQRCHMQGLEFDLVLAGSVFKGQGPLLVETLKKAIYPHAPRANITRARFEPVIGSLLLAFDAAGIPTCGEQMANLEASMPPPGFFSTLNSPAQQGDAS